MVDFVIKDSGGNILAKAGADLHGANLRKADLHGANLRGANLYGADLCWANLYGADLREADLREANLYWADLRWADLCGADLRGAGLYGANLCGADLRGASLRGANMCGANLCEADLRGANLHGAKAAGVPLVLDPIGSRQDTLLIWPTDKGMEVWAGCFCGNKEEFLEAVSKTHGDNKHAKAYRAAIALFEIIRNIGD